MTERRNNPKIYIVLPVHNRIDITRKFIECLKNQTYRNYHLVLVDDGSTDGTADYVRKEIDNLTILRGNGNLWWAGALHRGYRYLSKVRAADDDIVYINNDDSTFDNDYLERVVNDPELGPKTLIISPGRCTATGFVERGFAVDWLTFSFHKLKEGQEPDALTTRGLYMHYATYRSLGPMRPRLLPHYMSDLEYTMRAKRLGCRLVVSNYTHVYVDRSSTGQHKDASKTMKEFLYNHLVSKKTAYNTFYWGNFALLASPRKNKIKNFLEVYRKFKVKYRNFCSKQKQFKESLKKKLE